MPIFRGIFVPHDFGNFKAYLDALKGFWHEICSEFAMYAYIIILYKNKF